MNWRRNAGAGGASLIEVLVALLVVATGALGLAGLQIGNAQNNRTALHRSLATLFASDMLERIRANPSGRYQSIGEGPPGAFADCAARACAPAELAAFDVAVWKCSLGKWNEAATCATARASALLPPLERQRGLPAGDGTVAVQGGFVTVTVLWRGARAGRVVVGGRP